MSMKRELRQAIAKAHVALNGYSSDDEHNALNDLLNVLPSPSGEEACLVAMPRTKLDFENGDPDEAIAHIDAALKLLPKKDKRRDPAWKRQRRTWGWHL